MAALPAECYGSSILAALGIPLPATVEWPQDSVAARTDAPRMLRLPERWRHGLDGCVRNRAVLLFLPRLRVACAPLALLSLAVLEMAMTKPPLTWCELEDDTR